MSMHFWIDKRSQACGFGRSRVAASLSNASSCGGGYGHQPPRRHLTSKSTSMPPPSFHRNQSQDNRFQRDNSRNSTSISNNSVVHTDNNCNDNLNGANNIRNNNNLHRNSRCYSQQQQTQQHRHAQQIRHSHNQQQNCQQNFSTTINDISPQTYIESDEHLFSVVDYINENGNYCNNRSYPTTTTTTITDENSVINNHYSSPLLISNPIMSSNPTNNEANTILNTFNMRNNLNNNNQSTNNIISVNNNQMYHHVNITLPHVYGGSPNAQNLESGPQGLMSALSTSAINSPNTGISALQQTTSLDHQNQQNHHNLIENPESQLLPSHLKCGMWASLVLASVFVAGAKFYFDHQGTGLEVLIFCAFSATFFLAACTVSLCRFPRELATTPTTSLEHGLDASSINGSINATVINGMINNSSLNVQNNRHYSQNGYDHIQYQHQEQNQLLAIASAVAPPPYHIAILLPETTSKELIELDETPPPSYDKILI